MRFFPSSLYPLFFSVSSSQSPALTFISSQPGPSMSLSGNISFLGNEHYFSHNDSILCLGLEIRLCTVQSLSCLQHMTNLVPRPTNTVIEKTDMENGVCNNLNNLSIFQQQLKFPWPKPSINQRWGWRCRIHVTFHFSLGIVTTIVLQMQRPTKRPASLLGEGTAAHFEETLPLSVTNREPSVLNPCYSWHLCRAKQPKLSGGHSSDAGPSTEGFTESDEKEPLQYVTVLNFFTKNIFNL